jgi:hypothetical protein
MTIVICSRFKLDKLEQGRLGQLYNTSTSLARLSFSEGDRTMLIRQMSKLKPGNLDFTLIDKERRWIPLLIPFDFIWSCALEVNEQ